MLTTGGINSLTLPFSYHKPKAVPKPTFLMKLRNKQSMMKVGSCQKNQSTI